MATILNIENEGLIEKLMQGKQLLVILKAMNEFEDKIKNDNKTTIGLVAA